MGYLIAMFQAFVNILFPKVCNACFNVLEDNAYCICIQCRHNLPLTNFHINNPEGLKKKLYGRAKIENATALFYFNKKGLVQQLIHQLKYKNQQEIGSVLGDWLGAELTTIPAYKQIDLVIPVPLHKKKLKQRGYNQVATFGIALANALNCDYVDDVLVKELHTESQINKNRFSRWRNNAIIFNLKHPEKINNKHILLVDDLITTGATLEKCIVVLNQGENVKISIATIATA